MPKYLIDAVSDNDVDDLECPLCHSNSMKYTNYTNRKQGGALAVCEVRNCGFYIEANDPEKLADFISV